MDSLAPVFSIVVIEQLDEMEEIIEHPKPHELQL